MTLYEKGMIPEKEPEDFVYDLDEKMKYFKNENNLKALQMF